MIIGITGSTAGIGKDIKRLPHQFIEFNREHGDIHDTKMVYSKLKDCDVFINNAWDGDCQSKLLKYFFDKTRYIYFENEKVIFYFISVKLVCMGLYSLFCWS